MTPLSYMFKLLLALTTGTGLILWAPGVPWEAKITLLEIFCGVLVLWSVGVLCFAWFKPKDLS